MKVDNVTYCRLIEVVSVVSKTFRESRLWSLCTVLLTAVVVASCVAPPKKMVSLSSTAVSGSERLKKFVVVPGPGITPASDFENISNVLVFSLIEMGYVLATMDDADIVIGVDYRDSSVTSSYATSQPVYGTVPGPVSLINLSSMPIGGVGSPIMTTGTVVNIPQTAVVGQQTVTRSVTVKSVSASIGAYKADELRRYVRRGTSAAPSLLWRVDVSAGVAENGRPLEVTADLMRAASRYAGKSSGGRLDVPVVHTRLGSQE